mmetsp:Transcript_24466/g.35970  ORF Transcript_24466/g.35970 Transcript_24466/m.35970 type:complete len:304 (+) Transcript_24466:87-998(+)
MHPRIFSQIKKYVVTDRRRIKALEKHGKCLTRRDVENIRKLNVDESKLKLLVCGLVPILGNVFVPIALYYPNLVKPSFLWSERDFVKNTIKEAGERAKWSRSFRDSTLLPNASIIASRFSTVKSRKGDAISVLEMFAPFSAMGIDSLSSAHIVSLCRAHSLCSAPFMYTLAPASWQRKWLKIRAEEIITDDKLLYAEGLHDLTEMELVTACLRRGLLDKQERNGNEVEVEDSVTKDKGTHEVEGVLKLGNWDRNQLEKRLQNWVDMNATLQEAATKTSTDSRTYNLHSAVIHAVTLPLFNLNK